MSTASGSLQSSDAPGDRSVERRNREPEEARLEPPGTPTLAAIGLILGAMFYVNYLTLLLMAAVVLGLDGPLYALPALAGTALPPHRAAS